MMLMNLAIFLMTPDLEKYYELRLDMFLTDAWKDLIVDVQKMEQTTDTLDNVTPDNVDFKKGELSIIRWLLNLENTTKKSYEEL